MKSKRIEIDTGKDNSDFNLEKKIKEYKEGIDYEVDETGNFYTILSERLKSVIWPNDYFWYNESVVAIDRQGKVESWRMAADNPREPYEKVVKGGLKEIMSDFGEKEPEVIKQQEDQNRKSEDYFLEKDTKEISNKKNITPWVIGGVFLVCCASFILLLLKKGLTCQKKSKKSCETRR